ncbi:MAG: ion transporter [Betaproteobacteria bacterium]|nr:ion transporter [Betaproteobacteria bacterium]
MLRAPASRPAFRFPGPCAPDDRIRPPPHRLQRVRPHHRAGDRVQRRDHRSRDPAGYRGGLRSGAARVNTAILGIFIAEALLKIAAAWPRPQDYFSSGWNLFDFGIIVLSLIPATGEFATVARLIRILRVLRLVTAMPKLRLMVATLVRCIPGMGHVLSLMGILFYVYGVAGFHLYGAHDPAHWGTLGRALLTLFQIATLEAWTDIMKEAMRLGPLHWIYFVSFVLLGTFVVVNLFVAVVINSLEESHREVAAAEAEALAPTRDTALQDLQVIRSLVADIDRRIGSLEQALERRGKDAPLP